MEEKERSEGEDELQVWSWGAGTEGQLCTEKRQDELIPQLLSSVSPLGPISFLACGGAHAIALTPVGKVFTWGRGVSGQLGHGDKLISLQPKLVDSLKNFVISHVSAGWSHSGFVSDTGCLFTCGDGSFGQLGHGDFESQFCPVKISHFTLGHVEMVSCGMRHSLALLRGDSGDQIYGFGSGKRGQLGVSRDKIKCINQPQVALGLEDVNIVSISANGDHSAALSADGSLYTWGRGFSGTPDTFYPQCVDASLSFTNAALGWNHALVLTGDGEVFIIGGKQHGMLSNPAEKVNLFKIKEPNAAMIERVPGLEAIKVVQIAAGAEHSAVVTEDGSVMTWGWGEHGQLGLGNTDDQPNPQVVHLHSSRTTHTSCKVYCGSGFTFTTRT